MFRRIVKGVVAVSGFITFVDIIGSPAVIQGASMEPTLNPDGCMVNDVAWLNRLAAKMGSIKRGDVITIYCPTEPNELHIKRVIGLPGDVIYSNGMSIVKIPEGYCWVEGDNQRVMKSAGSRRFTSKDSNVYGPVSLGLVESRVTWVIFPPHRMRKLVKNIPEPDRYLSKSELCDVAESLMSAAKNPQN